MISAQARLQTRLGSGTRVFLPLLDDEESGDVVLTCRGGERVACHSFFLSVRSSYFRKLFADEKKERGRRELPPLPVARGAVVQILRFLYSDVVVFRTDDSESLRELLFLANAWKLHSLIMLFSRMVGGSASEQPVIVTSIWDDLWASLDTIATDCELAVRPITTTESCNAVSDTVAPQIFRSHRIVLSCQSGFFSTLFYGNFREGSEKKAVELGNVSAAQFAAIHSVFYRGKLPSDAPLALVSTLIPLAEYFQFAELAAAASRAVTEVTEANFGEIFTVANEGKMRALEKSVVDFVVDHFDSIAQEWFVKMPKLLLQKALNTGQLQLDESVIFDRIIRWGFNSLGRIQPQETRNIRILDDAALRFVLADLLPPRVLFTQRNKKTLLGIDPFSINELIY